MKTNFSTFNYKNEEWTLTPPSTTTVYTSLQQLSSSKLMNKKLKAEERNTAADFHA
jgi:hypothetical protein